MLKQPLLSRIFKSSARTSPLVTDPESASSPSVSSPGTSTEVALKEKPALQKTSKQQAPEKAAAQSEAAQAKIAKIESVGGAASTDDKAVVPKRKRLSAVTLAKGLVLCGVVPAAAGFAFVQFAPARLRAVVLPNETTVTVPLSSPGDPQLEAFASTGDLFLTNQLLYRKLEAIAGVTVSSGSAAASAPPAPASSAASSDSKPGEAGTDASASSASQRSEPALPSQAERVVADAPPAPAIAPVDFSGTTIDSVLEMRVAVAKDVSGIGFATSGNGVITDLDGNQLKTLSPETGVLAEISGGIVVDGETMPSAFWVYPEDGGYVAVGDSWYRGRVLIALRERGLIAVNYVLLGDYLYSVVGSEMSPDWAIESLKAQAVAARSYALTHNIHPASEAYFDLDNTQRFQAYRGIGREANTTQAAVQATAGEFISHEGGIVESLYAASQAIVDDAHSGSGMSQLGAKDLAEQGYSYQEILAHYYPGTALGRLETDQE